MTDDLDTIDVAALTCVLGDILAERIRQVLHHNRTAEHDDSHDRREWAWLLGQRVHTLAVPWYDAAVDERRQLVEVAAIAVAAIQAHDRRHAGVVAAPEDALPWLPHGGRRVYVADRNSDDAQAMVKVHGLSCGMTIDTPECGIRTPISRVHWHLPNPDITNQGDTPC